MSENVGVIQGNKKKKSQILLKKIRMSKDARTHISQWDRSYQCEKKGTTQYYTQTECVSERSWPFHVPYFFSLLF